MFALECLRDVAVPANRQISRHRLNRRGDWNLSPFDCRAFRIEQRGFVINQIDLSEWPATEGAVLVAIPFLQDAAHQAVCISYIQLQQALLSAVFFQWPSPTVFETKIGLSKQ